jgi:hypothetical protein
MARPWEARDDEWLWQERHQDVKLLAERLGRSHGGIRSRLEHLMDPLHKAYHRLHADSAPPAAQKARTVPTHVPTHPPASSPETTVGALTASYPQTVAPSLQDALAALEAAAQALRVVHRYLHVAEPLSTLPDRRVSRLVDGDRHCVGVAGSVCEAIISAHEPSWKARCHACWSGRSAVPDRHIDRSVAGDRRCVGVAGSVCETIISAHEPSWKIRCHACWSLARPNHTDPRW